jgi:hypothetical protein
VRLSHMPEAWGSLDPISGLGGSLGARCGARYGEYRGRRGGGGKKAGLLTMTGVDGLDGGEVGGVLSLSIEGDSSLLIAGDNGGWLGGRVVGLMPGTLGGLDIN